MAKALASTNSDFCGSQSAILTTVCWGARKHRTQKILQRRDFPILPLLNDLIGSIQWFIFLNL